MAGKRFFGLDEKIVGEIRNEVECLLRGRKDGHGMEHMLRVERMALRFADPVSDLFVVSAIALLHDVDDEKLFAHAVPGSLETAREILARSGVPGDAAECILGELAVFGFRKRLKGLCPATPEGQAVSDADMCDVLGAEGLVRMAEYSFGTGVPFFDTEDVPNQRLDYDSYTVTNKNGPVRHMFDKVLRLPGFALTEKGRIEMELRKSFTVQFLKELFRETGQEKWDAYLRLFLEGDMSPGAVFGKG